MTRGVVLALMLLLAACAGGPPAPDWQANARAALDQGVAAHLAGDSRSAASAFERARAELARTGRLDLAARGELMRCAALVASLEFGPCAGFDALRDGAADAERAYAGYLLAQPLSRAEIERLPPAQRSTAAAVAGGEASLAALQAIDDPWSRLIAVAVLFQAGKASPAMLEAAVDTASAQGWRRPLLAWLNVQLQRAEGAGAAAEAERLRQRIALVLRKP